MAHDILRILLTGANGQLGRCLQDRFPAHWIILAADSKMLDITNMDQVISCVKDFNPNIIINTAAYTAVDKAEIEQVACQSVNDTGVYNLAQVSAQFDVKFVHISTDYVFDGTSNVPYTEEMSANPQSVYGGTKLAGEHAAFSVNPNSIIIRTAWVFSEYGNNFVKTMLNLGKTRDQISVVADQLGCPTYAADIAQAIIELLGHANVRSGIYHFCGDKAVSWYEFAQAIFSIAQRSEHYLFHPIVNPITTKEYPTPAQRPRYSVLACNKINALGIASSDWRSALSVVIDKVLLNQLHS